MDISIDDLTDGKVIALLNQHLEAMHQYSPAESVHAIDFDKLNDPNVTFWSVRIGGELAGCGALKVLSSNAAELKSMKTADAFLRQGVAASLLVHLIAEAKARGYTSVSLETGSHEAFKPAIALYKRFGFVECGPFAEYKLDPYSRFFTKLI
ncbi:GNAT family N-acetyltransferase [Alteromonas facilis]|uniref:GNAT family N-acetyltransferase n=1 Tax=Alteromonas facilis TaxID=2048004 RepID=UPI000C289BD3|nr:GNAT family N-acetyltransferase [Alteromonas facilis]